MNSDPRPKDDGNPETAADFFGLRHEGRVMEKCVRPHNTWFHRERKHKDPEGVNL